MSSQGITTEMIEGLPQMVYQPAVVKIAVGLEEKPTDAVIENGGDVTVTRLSGPLYLCASYACCELGYRCAACSGLGYQREADKDKAHPLADNVSRLKGIGVPITTEFVSSSNPRRFELFLRDSNLYQAIIIDAGEVSLEQLKS